MNDFLMWTADFMKDRPVYPVVRRGLNVLFVAGITSWWYSQCYSDMFLKPIFGSVDWHNYLMRGEYFIPVAMFVIVYVFTWLIPFLIYKLFTIGFGVKIKRQIIHWEATHNDVYLGSETIQKVSSFFTEKKLDEKGQSELYENLKSEMKQEEIAQMREELDILQDAVCDNFIMVFRMLIAAFVYYGFSPQFSLWLLIVLVVVIIFVLINLVVAGLMFDILPVLVRKADDVAGRFFRRELPG